MGCGASKGPESAVAPAQSKNISQVPQAEAGGLAVPEKQGCPNVDSGKKKDVVMEDVAWSKAGDMESGAVSMSADTVDGEPKSASQKTLSVLVIAEPQCAEQGDAMPEQPASAEPERPPSAESENPARAAFRARFSAKSPDDLPPSPVAFKSSRSLNRSIGVRRRTSENDPGSQPEAPMPVAVSPEEAGAPAEPQPPSAEQDWCDEEAEEGPDPLREHFELTKEQNPLLAVGRKSTTNGILSCKASEKSLKSHKRLAVGFALDDGGDGGGGGDGTEQERPASGGGGGGGGGGGRATLRTDSASSRDTRDLDPDDHMEAERLASVSSMPEERPAPVVVQVAAA